MKPFSIGLHSLFIFYRKYSRFIQTCICSPRFATLGCTQIVNLTINETLFTCGAICVLLSCEDCDAPEASANRSAKIGAASANCFMVNCMNITCVIYFNLADIFATLVSSINVLLFVSSSWRFVMCINGLFAYAQMFLIFSSCSDIIF